MKKRLLKISSLFSLLRKKQKYDIINKKSCTAERREKMI